jgi:hypothetical protein
MNTILSVGAVLAGCCFLGALAATPVANDSSPPAALGLMQLREDFHLATTLGDYELMLSLWTDDAEFHGGPNDVYGATNIADFFATSPGWGTTLSLTSESKAEFDAQGNTAMCNFECIIVRVDGGDPLTTSLSSIPPGSQNPDVEIIQHSNASVFAVREDGRWKFAVFNGTAGPI